MICIIALIVFSIMGIFSATHRALAKEAFDCVFKRITLRPCDTGFNEKVKSKVIGKLINRSEFAARVFHKHSELISWFFFILTIGSAIFVVRGGYNFYLYGSCNGLNQSGFCIFDPAGENNKTSSISSDKEACPTPASSEKDLNFSVLNLSQFPQKIFGSKNQLVFIGCYECDYSRKAYPMIKQLIEDKKVDFIFAHLPIKKEFNFLSNYAYCAYKQDPEKFWDFNDKMFAADKSDLLNNDFVEKLAQSAGYDAQKLKQCVADKGTSEAVQKQIDQIKATGIYGTPTIFINGEALVGPKPYRVYERMIK